MPLNAIDNLTQLTSFEPTTPKNAPPTVEPVPSGSFRNHLEKVETQQAPEASSAQPSSSKSTDEPTSTDNQKAVARDSDDSHSDENATDGAERDGAVETDAGDSSATSAGPANEDDSNDVVELDEQAILEAQALALVAENLGQQTDSQDDGQRVEAEAEGHDIKETPDARKTTLKQTVTSQQEPTPDGKETDQQKNLSQQQATTEQEGKAEPTVQAAQSTLNGEVDITQGAVEDTKASIERTTETKISGGREVAQSEDAATLKLVETADDHSDQRQQQAIGNETSTDDGAGKQDATSDEDQPTQTPAERSQQPDRSKEADIPSNQVKVPETQDAPKTKSTNSQRTSQNDTADEQATPSAQQDDLVAAEALQSESRVVAAEATAIKGRGEANATAASAVLATEELASETIERMSRPTRSAKDDESVNTTPTRLEDTQTPGTGRLAAGRLGSGSSGGPTEGSGSVDQVRFVQRVARAFQAASDRGGEVRLRLSPPELGSMRLEISVKSGVLTAHLETETSAARTVLLDNLPALRDRLAEQNIKIDRFDVDVNDGSSGGSQDSTAADTRQDRDEAGGGAEISGGQTSEEADAEAPRPSSILGDGQLNVVV